VARLTLAIVLTAVLAACQTGSPPATVPTPSPSPTPHSTAIAAILQSTEVPSGLTVCLGSGPIDVYLVSLSQADPTAGARASAQWQQMTLHGARDGAISLFAANTSACNADLGATSSVKAIASFVARFDDSGQAHRAWEAGVFGFTPPPPGQIVTGVTGGTATGLGLSSFTYERPSVRLGSWQRSVFVALLVASNFDSGTFKTQATTIDARLN
jgi:hypothetical protein